MDNIVCIKCNSTFLLTERLICNDKINYCIPCFNSSNDTGKFIMITLKERLEKYNVTKLQKIIPVIGFSKNKIININNQ